MQTRLSSHRTIALNRRRLLHGAAAGAAVLALGGPAASRLAAAQSMDPFTFITAMPATDDIGQVVGQHADEIEPMVADDRAWDAYIQLPIKEGQDFKYTCEFDSAWIILKAYGYDLELEQQLEIVGHDQSVEPWYEETSNGAVIWGGDIGEHFSGDYKKNFLARSTAGAISKVFDAVDLETRRVEDRESIEDALLQGHPVFFKSTVDFLPWMPTTWIAPDGDEFPVVLGNDHALVAMGFNEEDVIIRDPLGPTSSNEQRPYQYRVSWDRYLEVLSSQGNDGLAVAPSEGIDISL